MNGEDESKKIFKFLNPGRFDQGYRRTGLSLNQSVFIKDYVSHEELSPIDWRSY